MVQADLEDLILQSTGQARAMAEKARQGMEGLTLIEQTADQAALRLETEVAHTRSVITATRKVLDDLQVELDKRDGQVHTALIRLEDDSTRIEKDVEKACVALKKNNDALITQNDASLKALKKQLLKCQKEVEALTGFAGTELGKLRNYTTDVSKLVGDLREQATSLQTQLDGALKTLLAEHDHLDRVMDTQLAALEAAYNQAMVETEKRLAQLETDVAAATQSAGQHVEDVLVQKLGKDLRKAADDFGHDLTAISGEMTKIVETLGVSQMNFRDNMTKTLEPNITKIANGLYNAAQNLGWV